MSLEKPPSSTPPKNSSRECETPIKNNNDCKKECVNKRLFTQPFLNNSYYIVNEETDGVDKRERVEPEVLEEFKHLYYDRRRYGLMSLRVLPRVKMVWDYMPPEDKKTLRELFENLVLEYSKTKRMSIVNENKNIVLNLNVNQQIMNVSRNENALKLKREIDRLNRELEKASAENLELRRELEVLRAENERLRNVARDPGLDELKGQVARLQSRLEDAAFSLDVAVKCLSREDCAVDKLLGFLENQLERMDGSILNRNKDLVESAVRSLSKG